MLHAVKRHTAEPRAKARGFTAIELLVVISILGILAAIAVPSMRNVMDRSRVNNAFDEISGAINFARSEAVKTRLPAILAQRPCSTGQDWSCGWIVFVDANANNSRDASEPILRQGSEFKGLNVMHVGGASDKYIGFNTAGYANNNPGRFVISPKEAGVGSSAITTLCLARTARIRRVAGEATCL